MSEIAILLDGVTTTGAGNAFHGTEVSELGIDYKGAVKNFAVIAEFATAKPTAATIKFQGSLDDKVKVSIRNKTTISFGDGTGSSSRDELLDSANGLNGFTVGRKVVVSGSTSNDGTYTILAVSKGALEIAAASLTTEVAGDSVSILDEIASLSWIDLKTITDVSQRSVGLAVTDMPFPYVRSNLSAYTAGSCTGVTVRCAGTL